jgi:Protein of unknown function (DUF664)
MLQGWPDYHRATLLIKCAGSSAEQLKLTACPPSDLSLLGLVRHLTDVERGWFLRGVAGRSSAEAGPLYSTKDDPDGDFSNLDSASAEAVLTTYEATIADVSAATEKISLDHTFTNGGEPWSTRWVYLRLIEEYARHNGHADLIRERIDGATEIDRRASNPRAAELGLPLG